eukprot:Ihof_evm9s158 gene=Ihof_evmTU9s158
MSPHTRKPSKANSEKQQSFSLMNEKQGFPQTQSQGWPVGNQYGFTPYTQDMYGKVEYARGPSYVPQPQSQPQQYIPESGPMGMGQYQVGGAYGVPMNFHQGVNPTGYNSHTPNTGFNGKNTVSGQPSNEITQKKLEEQQKKLKFEQ